MGEALNSKPRASWRLRVGLLSSGLAIAALTLTCITGNRDVGFGRSVSRSEQRLLLLTAALFFLGFAVANLVRFRAGMTRSNRRRNG